MNNAYEVSAETTARVYTPARVALPGRAKLIAAGGSHSCAKLVDQSVWCWGNYLLGKVAQSPTLVSGVCDAVQLSAGSIRTCALSSDGHVQCWGRVYDLTGSAGLDQNSNSPILLEGVASVTSISAGAFGGCLAFANGSLKCYGGYLAFAGDIPDCVPGFVAPSEMQ
jgi:alpha-tubulin suppressor-like RCC1 family protein